MPSPASGGRASHFAVGRSLGRSEWVSYFKATAGETLKQNNGSICMQVYLQWVYDKSFCSSDTGSGNANRGARVGCKSLTDTSIAFSPSFHAPHFSQTARSSQSTGKRKQGMMHSSVPITLCTWHRRVRLLTVLKQSTFGGKLLK